MPQGQVTPSLAEVTPHELERTLRDVTIVDVREPFERRGGRIDGSVSMPLSGFDADALRQRDDADRLVFHCKTGTRSAKAAAQFASDGRPATHLAGGLDRWQAEGKPVVRNARALKLDVMRQVHLIAGGLVLVGTLLGAFVTPALLAIPIFIGGGLVVAGLTGWCGMAKLLATMPWNRP